MRIGKQALREGQGTCHICEAMKLMVTFTLPHDPLTKINRKPICSSAIRL
jgi:hypothetical protein